MKSMSQAALDIQSRPVLCEITFQNPFSLRLDHKNNFSLQGFPTKFLNTSCFPIRNTESLIIVRLEYQLYLLLCHSMRILR